MTARRRRRRAAGGGELANRVESGQVPDIVAGEQHAVGWICSTSRRERDSLVEARQAHLDDSAARVGLQTQFGGERREGLSSRRSSAAGSRRLAGVHDQRQAACPRSIPRGRRSPQRPRSGSRYAQSLDHVRLAGIVQATLEP